MSGRRDQDSWPMKSEKTIKRDGAASTTQERRTRFCITGTRRPFGPASAKIRPSDLVLLGV